MRDDKIRAIQGIIDSSIKSFVTGFELKHTSQVENPVGIINQKKNNIFINELGDEFMFYSAFVRSFDSSFGNVLENMGNSIARLSYDVLGDIESYILNQQVQHIDYLVADYKRKVRPTISDYATFSCRHPQHETTDIITHKTDNYFFNPRNNTHYVIELKAGGDLDIKKAQAEKVALMREYFLLRNSLIGTNDTVVIRFATAYNKFGEGNQWKQSSVRYFFADEELLIGKDYWNFVCDDENGFDVVFEQYQRSAILIKEALERIKNIYFG